MTDSILYVLWHDDICGKRCVKVLENIFGVACMCQREVTCSGIVSVTGRKELIQTSLSAPFTTHARPYNQQSNTHIPVIIVKLLCLIGKIEWNK